MSPFRFCWRLLWRGATAWSAVLAVVVLSGVATYSTAYPTAESRRSLVIGLGTNKGLVALYGKGVGLDTAGGFLAWRYGTGLILIAALWALLAVSRLLRGDEDEGRVDLLLASPLRPLPLLRAQMTAFLVAAALFGTVAIAACLVSGLAVTGSILFGLAATGTAVLFGSLAAVTSQVVSPRRAAAGWVGASLGASFLVRAVGDTAPGREWLVWLSPVGWVEQLSPFVADSILPLVPMVTASAALMAVAAWLRTRRDLGVGLADGLAATRSGGTRLSSALALDRRLTRGPLIAWSAGVFLTGLILGFIAYDLAVFTEQDSNTRELLARIAGPGYQGSESFLAFIFAIVGVGLALFAGSQVVSGREEEASGRVDGLLTMGVSRTGWLTARAAVIAAATIVVAVVFAIGTWIGTILSGAPISVVTALGASLNALPVAFVFGGLALLTFGLRPRWTTVVAFGSVIAGYLVQVAGGAASAPSGLLDLSPFTHVSLVPAQPADLTAAAVMVAVGVGFGVLGAVAFNHRDVVPA
jgi:ABC-2 type transport system permease protein